MQYAVSCLGFGIHVLMRSISFKLYLRREVTISLNIVLISNSVYKEFRGTALGLGQVVAGLCRFLVPSTERNSPLGTLFHSHVVFVEHDQEPFPP